METTVLRLWEEENPHIKKRCTPRSRSDGRGIVEEEKDREGASTADPTLDPPLHGKFPFIINRSNTSLNNKFEFIKAPAHTRDVRLGFELVKLREIY